MADTRSRGGKKQGMNNPQQREAHQGVGTPDRPERGQPGGPKESAGKQKQAPDRKQGRE